MTKLLSLLLLLTQASIVYGADFSQCSAWLNAQMEVKLLGNSALQPGELKFNDNGIIAGKKTNYILYEPPVKRAIYFIPGNTGVVSQLSRNSGVSGEYHSQDYLEVVTDRSGRVLKVSVDSTWGKLRIAKEQYEKHRKRTEFNFSFDENSCYPSGANEQRYATPSVKEERKELFDFNKCKSFHQAVNGLEHTNIGVSVLIAKDPEAKNVIPIFPPPIDKRSALVNSVMALKPVGERKQRKYREMATGRSGSVAEWRELYREGAGVCYGTSYFPTKLQNYNLRSFLEARVQADKAPQLALVKDIKPALKPKRNWWDQWFKNGKSGGVSRSSVRPNDASVPGNYTEDRGGR